MRRIRGLRHGTGKKDAGRDRVTPKFLRPGGRTGFGSIRLGASSPDERSDIREQEKEKIKQGRRNAGRRQLNIRTLRGAARAQRGALRLPAFHRGSCGSEPTPPFSSRRASWDVVVGGRYSAVACPSPAIQSQTGRNAGRAFSRSRPGAEVTSPCPRAPLSLH